MFWSNIVDDCKDECEKKGEVFDPDNSNSSEIAHCCQRPCLLAKSGILIFSNDPNIKPFLDKEGIIVAFLMSVKNNTIWEPIIRSSVGRCYEDFQSTTYGYYCNTIPFTLEQIISCCYKQTFLKCPDYDMKRRGCKETFDFVQDCYENY